MKKFILLLLPVMAFAAVLFVARPGTVYAQTTKQIACEAAGGTYSGTTCASPTGEKTVKDSIATAVNILSYIAGVASIIMIIVGGIKYTTSSGDSNAVGSAKNTILYAIIGLVIALLAQAMVRFVFGKANG